MPEINPETVWASTLEDFGFLLQNENFSFANFKIDPKLTEAHINEDEQKLLFLFRAMKRFESYHGSLIDSGNGRQTVHRAFIHTKRPRQEQRAFTQSLMEMTVSAFVKWRLQLGAAIAGRVADCYHD